jgi:hypothetical protein
VEIAAALGSLNPSLEYSRTRRARY